MIYRFRVILDNDTKEDIFRDIEIRMTDTLEDLHNSIVQAFGFDGSEMASFYLSDDDWTQGEEISLFDVSDSMDSVRLMNESILDDTVHKKQTKLIYIYDFLSMWTFFVELAEIVDAVGDKIDVVCEGGIRRGTHVLKALSLGAKACSGGRMYLYALAAGGQKGVEKAMSNLRDEIERDMKLMGVTSIDQLSRKNLRFR